MPRAGWTRSVPLLAVLASTIHGCGGGGSGGGGGPTEPPMPAPTFGSARFELSGAGYDEMVSYDAGMNLVFCRTGAAAGFADLWIRFAEQPAADGENGPHLDLDLCSAGDGGSFVPRDPMDTSCAGEGKTFDVWWHGPGGDTFVNQPGAAGCSVQLTRAGGSLSGVFECRGMEEIGGPGSLDLLGGSFECAEG